MQAASGHCQYAYKDDYPWGTVRINGKPRVVCKCTKKDCIYFTECRKNTPKEVDEEDIFVLPKIETQDYSVEQKYGEAFIDSLKKSKTEEEPRNNNFLDQKDVDTTDSISSKEKQESYKEINIKKDEKAEDNRECDTNKIILANKHPQKSILFADWMRTQGKSEQYISFITKSVNSIDIFAHSHNIWDGHLFAYDQIAALNLINKFRNIEVSGRDNIMKKQLMMAVNIYEKYIQYIDNEKQENDKNKSAIKNDEITDEYNEENEEEKREITDVSLNKKTEILEQHPLEKDHITEKGKASNIDKKEENNQSFIVAKKIVDTKGFDSFTEGVQKDIIRADEQEHIVVNAGPGTGKTYTLIQKIVYMVNTLNVDPEEILVLCFSRAAVEVIKQRLREAYQRGEIGTNWQFVEIRTFDSFATRVLLWASENELDGLPEGFEVQNYDYEGRILYAKRLLADHDDIMSSCCHFIVDEVQDLVAERADFVKEIIESLPEECGYTLLGDACQSIYDYQIQEGQTSSSDFYQWIFRTQKDARFISLSRNYRQSNALETLSQSFRKAILSNDTTSMENTLEKIEQEIPSSSELKLKEPDREKLNRIIDGGSLGILTRTNGQALLISSWLRTADIPHTVQKRLSDHELNRWIADVFCNYPNDTVSEEDFVEQARQVVGTDDESCIQMWKTMLQTQFDRSKSRYNVEELLQGIVENGKDAKFFTNSEPQQIVVSNIHRAKGREFDNVIVLDNILEVSSEEDASEYKVSYVAITRAKKKIFKSNIGTNYIYLDKKNDRRAYQCGINRRKGNKFLTRIEIGRYGDIVPVSMANQKTQELIDQISSGIRVILKKSSKKTNDNKYITYDILLEEDIEAGDNEINLGFTSRKFAKSLGDIIREIINLSHDKKIRYEVYPESFSDIYIDDIVSIIKPLSTENKDAKGYGNLQIWKGITLTGFGRVDYNRY
jgi:superfamily I DNA/RNA helicase